MEIYSQPYRRTTGRLSVTLTREGDAYSLTVATLKDAPGTLYRLCAVLVRHDWNIENADICTREDHQIVDRFLIRPASREAVDEIKFEEMMKDFEHLLFESLDVSAYIAQDAEPDAPGGSRTDSEPTANAADQRDRDVEYTSSENRGRLTLTGKDRPGLLLDIAAVFTKHDVDILEARIETTEDGVVRNSFLTNPTDARFADADFLAVLSEDLRKLL
ncbi:MAG: ACT domain-containing protein [bacterium]|nr:ACT domain-containing protein [bacterium]